jgi:endonuclease/exonuclease/phosphatase (EEP) superfamily protein YafD
MLRALLWAAQGVLILAFAAAFAARYVHPRDAWWLQGVALALPFLTLLLVVAVVGHAVARQAAGVALYLMLLVAVAPRFVGWPARAGSGPVLRVLTFNADHTYYGAGGEAGLARVLDRFEPELVALQEASLVWFQYEDFATTTPGYRPLIAHPRLSPPPVEPELEGGRQLPVLTDGEWVSFEEVEIGGPDDDDTGPRSTLTRSEIDWEGQRIAVYNVHLRSFGPARPWRSRQRDGVLTLGAWREALATYRDDFRARAEDAERLRAALDAEPLPFLLCGDLNSTPHHWTYAHLSRGLVDAFGQAGRGWGATYHDRLPLVRIDYILASSHWRAISAGVPRGLASDHRSVVARLALRRSPVASARE